MASHISGNPGTKKITPKIDLFNLTFDGTTTAGTITKATLATAASMPVTAKFTKFQFVVIQDNGTNQVTYKASPTSQAVVQNVGGGAESEGERYTDGSIEEIDDFTIAYPIGSIVNVYGSFAKNGYVINV
jgi:hypothetical protein